VDEKSINELANQPLCPGVKDFIEKSYSSGIPMAIASSSTFEWVSGYLNKFDLTRYFNGIFTSRDVKFVKPNPDLYLLATDHLGFAPDQ
jgi:putative hydrolase of the HAD superfamily